MCRCPTPSLSIFSIEGHLGCFLVLAITSNVAMNMVERNLCSMIEHLLVICPRVVLLNPKVEWLYKLEFPPAIDDCSFYSTSSPA